MRGWHVGGELAARRVGIRHRRQPTQSDLRDEHHHDAHGDCDQRARGDLHGAESLSPGLDPGGIEAHEVVVVDDHHGSRDVAAGDGAQRAHGVVEFSDLDVLEVHALLREELPR